jgi:polyisoprenoid-binding protein YceI
MRYVAEPSQSRFTVQAFAAGTLSVLAHSPTFQIRDFTGELEFDPATPGDTSVRATVQADSLALIDSVSASDRDEITSRMRREVLETTSYPQVAFQSTQAKADRIAGDWYRLQLAGDLRLHGVTKPQQVEAQLRLSDGQARLSGRCALSLSAYRIKPVTALGALIKLKDELKLEFDVVCTTREP